MSNIVQLTPDSDPEGDAAYSRIVREVAAAYEAARGPDDPAWHDLSRKERVSRIRARGTSTRTVGWPYVAPDGTDLSGDVKGPA